MQTVTDRVILERLQSGASTMAGLCESTGFTMAAIRVSLEHLTLECLEIRQCQCGNTLSVEVEGYGGYTDHFGATRNVSGANAH